MAETCKQNTFLILIKLITLHEFLLHIYMLRSVTVQEALINTVSVEW
jgi:hypothetical protein